MWTDVVVCGNCGGRLRLNITGGKHGGKRQWRCDRFDPYIQVPGTICNAKASVLETVLVREVSAWLVEQAQPGVAEQWTSATENAAAHARKIETAQKGADAKRAEVTRYARLMGEGVMPDDVGAPLLAAARAEAIRLDEHAAALRAVEFVAPASPSHLDAVRQLLTMPDVDAVGAGRALRAVIARVEVAPARTDGNTRAGRAGRLNIVPRWAEHLGRAEEA